MLLIEVDPYRLVRGDRVHMLLCIYNFYAYIYKEGIDHFGWILFGCTFIETLS